MIHALIDVNRNIKGYECGTRTQFDLHHGGDPQWVFLDQPVIRYRVDTGDFLLNPTNYYISSTNFLVKHTSQTLTTIPQLD